MKRAAVGKPFTHRTDPTTAPTRTELHRSARATALTASTDAPDGTEHASLRASIERHRSAQLDRLGAGEDGMALGRANARFLDGCFRERFQAAAAVARIPPSGVALAAVGSFGRGAVALRSDADVVVVVGGARSGEGGVGVRRGAPLSALGRGALGRPPGARRRRRAGPRAEGPRDRDRPPRPAPPRRRRALVARARRARRRRRSSRSASSRASSSASRTRPTARHERFGGSVYLLEPDVKNGAGGLRDLDVARWAARARYRVGEGAVDAASTVGSSCALGVLVAARGARDRAPPRSSSGACATASTRTPGAQEPIGSTLRRAGGDRRRVHAGYGDEPRRARAERLMQDYYRPRARSVSRARETLLARATPPPRRRPGRATADLGGGVRLFDGQVTVAGAAELARRIRRSRCARTTRASGRARRSSRSRATSIARAARDPAWCEPLRASPEAARALRRARLRRCRRRALRRGSIGRRAPRRRAPARDDPGVLAGDRARPPRHLPRVHGRRSLGGRGRSPARARARRARRTSSRSRRRLAAEIARPRPLFLATLLHDVGKG